MKKYMSTKVLLLIVLFINALVIISNFIYVTPSIVLKSEPFSKERTDDVEEIKALEAIVAKGWATGDARMMASAYTDDADYVTFNGEWLKGKQAIIDTHQSLFDGVLKGSSLADREIKAIRFLTENVALVHVTGSVKQKWREKPAKSRKSIQTLVAIKKDGIWKFATFHNTRVSRISLWDAIIMSFK
ncbi:SgcJ/EcaC family oxidoreductase [Olivibacter domesticus]|nr:SgcJ/EcaC family oxidoreductase [Olivibacter domesticus]